jgi:DNA-binding transcriptional regulator GbsR (MarR family)
MEPKSFQDEQADAPAIIQDTQALRKELERQTSQACTQDTQRRVREEEDEEQADAQREQKAQKLENEMRKLDTYYNPTSRSTMDKQNVVEDDEESK